MTVPRVHTRGVQIGKSEQHLIRRVKYLWVPVTLHLLHDESCTIGNEFMAFIVDEGVVVPLALQRACGIICTTAQRVNTTLVAIQSS